jgi:hypothetical protein
MKKALILLSLIFIFFSCTNKDKGIKPSESKLDFNIEKIVIINSMERSVTYFKVKISNLTENNIVLLDNSLVDNFTKDIKPQKTGFYLKNVKNDSLITLGIDNNYYYEIGAKKSGFCFIAAANLKNSWLEKDSLLLKKMLSNYQLEYNGKTLDLNSIKKSKYNSQHNYNNFMKRKDSLTPYKDSISIELPIEKLNIKYLTKMPISQEEWNKL